jgi:hypothetical protein
MGRILAKFGIFIVIGIFLIQAVPTMFFNITGANQEKADLECNQFVRGLFPPEDYETNVVVRGHDGDFDGVTSCTATVTSLDTHVTEILEISCPTNRFVQKWEDYGCKTEDRVKLSGKVKGL